VGQIRFNHKRNISDKHASCVSVRLNKMISRTSQFLHHDRLSRHCSLSVRSDALLPAEVVLRKTARDQV
jgi:hypothetical protein